MSNKERKYIIALVLITMIAVIIRLAQPKPIDWSEGYSNEEKKPFGGYILFNELAILFPDREITVNNLPIFEQSPVEKSINQIFINSSFGLDEFETEMILNGVNRGNNLFISAWQIDGAFADSLNINISSSFPSINSNISNLDSLLQNQVSFTNTTLNSGVNWIFPVGLTESYFASFDTANTTILGTIGDEEANFIRIDYGRGSIFVHSNPFLFSNYFLKDIRKFDYAFTALSYLSDRNVIWDEYYKAGRANFASPLSYIVSQPQLKWAWFISLLGLVSYLIFGAKRKQRIIPEIAPVSNTSIQFTSTVANLYLNNGTHKEILEKKILFLMDYIRTNLNINPDESVKSMDKIAQRSGIETTTIHELFSIIEHVQNEKNITQKRLKQVTDQIDWFYKNSQR